MPTEKRKLPAYMRSGDDADSTLERKAAEQELRFIPRVYIKNPTSSDSDGMPYTFVDGNTHPDGYDMPYAYEEHQVQINGDWRNWFTCIEGYPHPETGEPMECPICRSSVIPLSQKKAYLAHAYTVINHSPYPTKRGLKNEKGDELTLLIAKQKFAATIKRRRLREKENGGLRGWFAYFIRTTTDGANTGNEISWEKKDELDESIVPLDYISILAAKLPQEIQKALAMGGLAEGSARNSGAVKSKIGPTDDEIPF